MKHTNSEIQIEAFKYFSDFYKADNEIDSLNQTWFLQHLPIMFDQATNEILEAEITKKDIESTLKDFA